MKLKIVIQVSMCSEKDRSKALRIASTVSGVSSVGIGKENDKVEVVGENVDAACLAKCLRKKFCVAHIISVEEVKPPKPKDPSPSKCRPLKCRPLLCSPPKCRPLPCSPPKCRPPCSPPKCRPLPCSPPKCRPPCTHAQPYQPVCDTCSGPSCPIL